MRASLAVPPVPGAPSAQYPVPQYPVPQYPPRPDAPAEIELSPLDRDGAALQFAGPHGGELRIGGAASDVADHGGQLEHADLGAGADVPGSRAAVAGRGEKRGDHVPDVHVVTGLPAVPVDRRLLPREQPAAEDRDDPRLA